MVITISSGDHEIKSCTHNVVSDVHKMMPHTQDNKLGSQEDVVLMICSCDHKKVHVEISIILS